MNDSREPPAEEPSAEDPFYPFYDRDRPAYGITPSRELQTYLQQCRPGGVALDLGAGPGRDTIALAQHGFQVTSVDASERGLQQLEERCRQLQLEDRVHVRCADVRDIEIPSGSFDAIVATTVLDHIPADDAAQLWERIVDGLSSEGVLYVEVHTTDDPGCHHCTAEDRQAPVSETAAWVVNYFPRNYLLRMAASHTKLRVLRYEERYEWDYTHGPEHKHGKAVLLATTAGNDPPWYGYPATFPRQVR